MRDTIDMEFEAARVRFSGIHTAVEEDVPSIAFLAHVDTTEAFKWVRRRSWCASREFRSILAAPRICWSMRFILRRRSDDPAACHDDSRDAGWRQSFCGAVISRAVPPQRSCIQSCAMSSWKVCSAVEATEPRAHVSCANTPQCRNSLHGLERDMRPVDLANEAGSRAGVEPSGGPARSGTDGSRLTEMGCPRPTYSLACRRYSAR